jgi:chorismate synthase
VRFGYTLGSPVALVVPNRDWKNWTTIMQVEPLVGAVPAEAKRKVEVPRPGHADLVGGIKYRHDDMRNVLERSSARETTMRVALATLARKFLEECGIVVASRVTRVGGAADTSELSIPVNELNDKIDDRPLRCTDDAAEAAMVKEVEQAKKEGNTLGGVFEVYATGVPLGLGSYAQWDRRLEGEIAKQFLSLNAIKGVDMGLGFAVGATPGTRAHDEIFPGSKPGRIRYETNRSGGIDGGMTTGQMLVVRAAMKPLATLMEPLRSVKLSTGEPASAHVERSDVCAVPSAAVIGESLLCLVLADALLAKFGGDSMSEFLPRLKEWHDSTRPE